MEHILILEWIDESLFYMCFTFSRALCCFTFRYSIAVFIVFLQYFVIFVIKKTTIIKTAKQCDLLN